MGDFSSLRFGSKFEICPIIQELSAVIAAQRPLIERFQKDVAALVQLVEQEDANCLDQVLLSIDYCYQGWCDKSSVNFPCC